MSRQPQSHCHFDGTPYVRANPDAEWPRRCPECGNLQWFNPTPIGVLLQTVVDRSTDRVGVLTPIRGHDPMRGHAALVGGFQEGWDQSSEDAGSREYGEEIRLSRPHPDDLEPLCSQSTGPFIPGRRQNLVFSVNPKPVPLSAFDGWQPDAETLAIEVSWGPRVLAFPSHTRALALYFRRYQGVIVPEHHVRQPRTGDDVDGRTVFNVPYDQSLLDLGIWRVELDEGGEAFGVQWRDGRWTQA